jgi:CheY-like chemotaxis protein
MAKRILIADDSLTIQRAFAMSFAGEDLTLLSARSADEGLTIARQSRPELVIADGVMPGRSGYELCAAIKSDPTLRGVPVYILTSSHNPYDEARGRQSGADGQLTKPFEAAALVERVGEALAKGAVSAAPVAASASPLLSPLPVVSAFATARGAPPAPEVGLPGGDDGDDYGEITVEADLPREPAREPAREPVRAPQPIQPFPPAVAAAPAPVAAPVRAPAPASAPAAASASEVTPPPRVPAPSPPRPATPGFTMSPGSVPGGLRPSLIPGLRPGAVAAPRPGVAPAARPFAVPGSTVHFSAASPATSPPTVPAGGSPAARGPAPTAPTMAPGPARTLVGLPASALQPPARVGVTVPGTRPPSQPQPTWPADTRTPPPVVVVPAPAQAPSQPQSQPQASVGASAAAAILSKVDQKVAAIAAKGPEYEAIAKLSREIIERIVWEVVPELAEVIIREELQKRGRV